jgi:hypothetical protein
MIQGMKEYQRSTDLAFSELVHFLHVRDDVLNSIFQFRVPRFQLFIFLFQSIQLLGVGSRRSLLLQRGPNFSQFDQEFLFNLLNSLFGGIVALADFQGSDTLFQISNSGVGRFLWSEQTTASVCQSRKWDSDA